MRVYQLDEKGYFIGEHECQVCPKTGSWLYPPHYTDIEVPPYQEGKRVRFVEDQWIYEDSYAGKVVYNITDSKAAFQNREHNLPKGYTGVQPPDDSISYEFINNEWKPKDINEVKQVIADKLLEIYKTRISSTDDEFLAYKKREEYNILTEKDETDYNNAKQLYTEQTLWYRTERERIANMDNEELIEYYNLIKGGIA
jgi:hypothetical protein